MHGVLWSARGKRIGKEETKMSAEENKALVRREQEELWNHTGNLDAAEELFAPAYAEAARQEAADFRQGFPDVVSTIEDLIAGGKIAESWTAEDELGLMRQIGAVSEPGRAQEA